MRRHLFLTQPRLRLIIMFVSAIISFISFSMLFSLRYGDPMLGRIPRSNLTHLYDLDPHCTTPELTEILLMEAKCEYTSYVGSCKWADLSLKTNTRAFTLLFWIIGLLLSAFLILAIHHPWSAIVSISIYSLVLFIQTCYVLVTSQPIEICRPILDDTANVIGAPYCHTTIAASIARFVFADCSSVWSIPPYLQNPHLSDNIPDDQLIPLYVGYDANQDVLGTIDKVRNITVILWSLHLALNVVMCCICDCMQRSLFRSNIGDQYRISALDLHDISKDIEGEHK